MSVWINDLLNEASKSIVQGCITLGFAYVTFKFFKNYKEKEANNKVYIKFLKLKDNIQKNIDNVQSILDLYEEGKILKDILKINLDNEYYSIITKIEEIKRLYISETMEQVSDEDYEIVSRFYRYRYDELRELDYEIDRLKSEGSEEYKIDKLQNEKVEIEKSDLFKDLEELRGLILNYKQCEEFNELKINLNRFHDVESKADLNIDAECKVLFFEDEQISDLISKQERINSLIIMFKKDTAKETIRFEFNNLDDSEDILAGYNAKLFFEFNKFIENNNNVELFISEKMKLQNFKEEANNIISKLELELKILQKKINSFKYIF